MLLYRHFRAHLIPRWAADTRGVAASTGLLPQRRMWTRLEPGWYVAPLRVSADASVSACFRFH